MIFFLEDTKDRFTHRVARYLEGHCNLYTEHTYWMLHLVEKEDCVRIDADIYFQDGLTGVGGPVQMSRVVEFELDQITPIRLGVKASCNVHFGFDAWGVDELEFIPLVEGYFRGLLNKIRETYGSAYTEPTPQPRHPEPASTEVGGEGMGELVRQWKAGEVTDLDLLRRLSELGIDVLKLPGIHQDTSSKPAKQAELLGLARRYITAKQYNSDTLRSDIGPERTVSRGVALYKAVEKLA